MKILKIKEDHYKAPLSLITDCDAEEFVTFMQKQHPGHEISTATNGQMVSWGGYFIVWVDKNVTIDKYFPILVHELLHYCIAVLDDRGVPVTSENDEDIAYFHEKMLKECMKKLKFEVKKSK